jgi:hypothetical protein
MDRAYHACILDGVDRVHKFNVEIPVCIHLALITLLLPVLVYALSTADST